MISATPKIDDPPFEPQSLQSIIAQIEDLARREASAELLEELRRVADAARRFAADGKHWAAGIAKWPNRLGGKKQPKPLLNLRRLCLICLNSNARRSVGYIRCSGSWRIAVRRSRNIPRRCVPPGSGILTA